MNQLFLAAKMMKEAEDEKSGIKSKPEPLPESPAQTMGRGGGLLMRTLIHDVKEAGETGHVHEETGKMLAAMLFAPHGKTLRMLLQTAAPAERRRLAATLLQSSYRGYVRRKAKAKQNYKINLKYELEILAARKKRRGLLVGFFQHLIYLTVLTAVVMLGGGPTPRFELATTLADYIDSTGFGDIATLADYQSWLKNDLFEGLVPSGEEGESRVYLKTYNEILGSIRIELVRVDASKCEWKVPGWDKKFRLNESEIAYSADGCAGDITSKAFMDSKPYGPPWDETRYLPNLRFDEQRYIMDLGRDPGFAIRRMEEMITTGFIDEMATRMLRVKLVTYNSALTMLCLISVDVDLGPTGVLTPKAWTFSMPVQEYMPNTMIRKIFFELILVTWTLFQALQEVKEIINCIKETGSIRSYLSDLFNVLDTIRFALFFTAVATRVQMLFDTNRDFSMSQTTYIDIEDIGNLYNTFDLLTAYVTLSSLFSTIQYFELTERTNVLKGTLAKAAGKLSSFVLIFMLFFLVYSIVGAYLLGSTIDMFSSLYKSLPTHFDMMNANVPMESLLEAVRGDDYIRMFTIAFYYYSFIILHYLLLLNVIIAIVVEAYIDVQEEVNKKIVAKIFRANQGGLDQDLSDMIYRVGYTIYLIFRNRFFPLKLTKELFIGWDDDQWYEIVETCVNSRFEQGLPSRSCSLSVLYKEIKKMPPRTRSIAERIANKKPAIEMFTSLTKDAFDVSTATASSLSKTARGAGGVLVNPSSILPTALGGKKKARGTAYQLEEEPKVDVPITQDEVAKTAEQIDMESMQREVAAMEGRLKTAQKEFATDVDIGADIEEDPVFVQIVMKFYNREYFHAPANLDEPMDESAQPKADTWYDCTLQKVSNHLVMVDKREKEIQVALEEMEADIADAVNGTPGDHEESATAKPSYSTQSNASAVSQQSNASAVSQKSDASAVSHKSNGSGGLRRSHSSATTHRRHSSSDSLATATKIDGTTGSKPPNSQVPFSSEYSSKKIDEGNTPSEASSEGRSGSSSTQEQKMSTPDDPSEEQLFDDLQNLSQEPLYDTEPTTIRAGINNVATLFGFSSSAPKRID